MFIVMANHKVIGRFAHAAAAREEALRVLEENPNLVVDVARLVRRVYNHIEKVETREVQEDTFA